MNARTYGKSKGHALATTKITSLLIKIKKKNLTKPLQKKNQISIKGGRYRSELLLPLIYYQVSHDVNSSQKLCQSKNTPFLCSSWLNSAEYHKLTHFFCPLNQLSHSLHNQQMRLAPTMQSFTFCCTLLVSKRKKKRKKKAVIQNKNLVQ